MQFPRCVRCLHPVSLPLILSSFPTAVQATLINATANLEPSGLTEPVIAQIVPDDTLGAEASIVTPEVTIQGEQADRINGGAIRGANLFHSFEDFTINTEQRVYFANPMGIENILSRVTGENISEIDGLLGIEGTANLFLINPNGVIFGPNAQLDINGSFLTSTANSLTFADGSEFRAVPLGNELLTVSVPLGVQFNDTPQGDITNNADLAVAPGERLVLFGEAVTSTGTLTAPGGQVQMLGDRVGLFEAAQIDVSAASDGGTIQIGGDFQGQSTLPTAEQTEIGPKATLIADATEAGSGGTIIVWSDGLTHFEGHAQAIGGLLEGDGGFIEISGAGSLSFEGAVSTAAPNGNWGTVLFDPTNILIVEDALAETTDLNAVNDPLAPDIGSDGDTRLAASSLTNTAANSNVSLQATNDIRFEAPLNFAESGVTLTAVAGNNILINESILFPNGGNVVFEASNNIELADTDIQFWTFGGNIDFTAGNMLTLNDGAWVDTAPELEDSGELKINAPVLMLSGSSLLNTGTYEGSSGNAGEIQISTNQLSVQDGARISASTFGSGDSGLIEITANDFIQLDGSGTGLFSQTNSESSGDAGDIQISTNQLFVRDGARIVVATLSTGSGGQLTLNAGDLIQLTGDNTILSSQTQSSGNAGDIHISTNQLFVQDRAQINTLTSGSGDGGLLTINATDAIQLSGAETGFFSQARLGSSGDAGEVEIFTGQLFVQDGARILTRPFGNGDGGRIAIIATDLIQLSGEDTGLSSRSDIGSPGDAGDIQLSTNQLIVQNGARVLTSTSGSGDGGLLAITATDSIQLSDEGTGLFSRSNIGSSGNAGDIQLSTNQLFIQNEAQVMTSTSGSGNGGLLTANANEILQLSGAESTGLISQTASIGNAGNIEVATNQLLIQGGSIAADTFASGGGGDIAIQANQVEVIGSQSGVFSGSNASLSTTPTGDAGSVSIDADTVIFQDSALINVNSSGSGNAGSIEILNANYVEFSNRDEDFPGESLTGAFAFANQGSGNGGRIDINSEKLTLSGDRTEIRVDGSLNGNAGVIDIISSEVTIENAANISSIGALGSIQIEADKFLEISNGSVIGIESLGEDSGVVFLDIGDLRLNNQGAISAGIEFTSEAQEIDTSLAGRIDVLANTVILNNQSQIGSSGGEIEITASTVSLDTNSTIMTTSAFGEGGSVAVQASDSLSLRNQSLIGAATGISGSSGQGGNINLNAPNIILSDGSILSASAPQGVGGIIDIQADNTLLLRNNSLISASAGLLGDAGGGGNVFIDADFVIGVLNENSDIIANAFAGNGGLVEVDAIEILGFIPRSREDIVRLLDIDDTVPIDPLLFDPQLLPTSDITAISQENPAISSEGEVNLNTPDIDLNRGLVELPTLSPSPPVRRGCSIDAVGTSSFTVSGRGGLPPSPTDILSRDRVLTDVGPEIETSTSSTNTAIYEPVNEHPEAIREARGAVKDADGQVTFLAQSFDTVTHRPAQQSLQCRGTLLNPL